MEPKPCWLRYFWLGQSLISLFPQPCQGGQERHSPKQNKTANNLKGDLCYLLSPVLESSEPGSLDHMQSVNVARGTGSSHWGGSRKAGASMS